MAQPAREYAHEPAHEPAGEGPMLLVQVYRVEGDGPVVATAWGWRLLGPSGREVLASSRWWSDPARALENAALTICRLMRQVAEAQKRFRVA